MTTVTAPDGFPLAVQVTGRDGGAPLLLLAGQANSHHWWDGLRDAFADRYRVITFDQRGTGGSRGAVGEWSTRSFAADAAHVLRALDAVPAAVYGTSMGGRVAQFLAVDNPELVERLVLACTSPGGPHALERSNEIRLALSGRDPAARRATLRELFYTEAWTGRSNLFGDPTSTGAETVAHLRVSGRHDAWAELPGIVAPTLVLHGADDRMVPTANAPLIAGRIPGAELYLHPTGRHGFFDEFATEVNARVREFLG